MISRVIIIGGHIQALGIARQAHQLGIDVILYLTETFSVARWSNAVSHTIHGTLDAFINNISAYRNSNTLLVPTGDDAIMFLNSHRNELSDNFILGIPHDAIITTFGDKRKTADFTQKHGIPHPKCFCPNTIEELASEAPYLTYPVVLKPSVMYTFHRIFGKKAFLCNTSVELINRAKAISEHFPINQLIVQEFLEGGPKHLYSYGVYAVDGVPVVWIVANRIRQNPMDFGNSTTFAITCDIPEVEKTAKDLLAITKYTGFAEIEFMYNRHSNRYELLEVNTRLWKWHTISMKCGFGFFETMLCHLNGKSPTYTPGRHPVAWVERLTDTAIVITETLHHRMSLRAAIMSYKTDKQSAVWSVKDPLPAIMYLLLSPILYFTRH